MKKILVLILAALMLCTVACTEEKEPITNYLPIEWEMLTGLPEDFPKLCDKVTSTEENSAQNAVSIYWNLIKKDTFKSYLSKIEGWAGVKFNESVNEGNGVSTFTLETDKHKVECAYNPNATGNHIEAHLYDCQARVTVVGKQ